MTARSPPVTRKMAASLRVYEDYPASPSTHNAAEGGGQGPIGNRREPAIEQTTHTARAPSVCSRRSTASATARIKQAEYEAEQRLLQIRQEELRMQAELVKKRLAFEVATINEETERESIQGDHVETERRVTDWLDDTRLRGESGEVSNTPYPTTTSKDKSHERTHKVTFEPTPRHGDEPLIRLTDAIEKMARTNTQSRRVSELPIFSGDSKEWLPFKAAWRDSVQIYNLTATEHMCRLRLSLRGEARQAVSALLYTESEPAVIIKTLEQCYGRPEVIVDQALEDIKRLPRLGSSATEINAFAIRLQNIVTVITSIDERGYLKNPMITRNVIERLSPHIRARWADYAEDYGSRDECEIITLSRFLMREADRAMRHAYGNTPTAVQKAPGPKPRNDNRPSKPVYAAAIETVTQCLCCGDKHRTPTCAKLSEMSVKQRWDWAKGAGVCYQCLDSKHRKLKCKKRKCGVDECRYAHHALLHSRREEKERHDKTETVTAASAHAETKQRVLLKVCPIVVEGANKKKINTFALLDEGSTVTLIDQELANLIGARGPKKALNIIGATSKKTETASRLVSISVRGQEGHVHRIKARTVANLMLGRQTISRDRLSEKYLAEIKDANVCYESAHPRILIGADNWHLIVTRRLLTGKRGQPAASLTMLGWVIHGTISTRVACANETVLHTRQEDKHGDNVDSLEALVKSHYDIDALGISHRVKANPAEVRATEIADATAIRKDGRYEIGLPWISDDVTLPPSYNMALSRLRNTERRLDKCSEMKKAYTQQIEGLLEKGYAERSTHDPTYGRTWFLPHFAVTNPNKPGKVRLVFDAAARSNGICLNDALLEGPDMLHSLPGILFGFRIGRVGLTADIREMFLRVKIRSEDQAAQHFLWRGEDRTRSPDVYKMTSMIFGAKSSPFLAHTVRDRNATDFQTTHELAHGAITKRHYMDDWVDSFDSEDVAARTIKEVIHVHEQAGFHLAGWSTNRPQLLNFVREEDRALKPKELGANVNTCDKALGVVWDARADELAFNTTLSRVPADVKERRRAPTKREALGAVMSLFDPLGLLSPYTITAKIMLQGLWRKQVEWDAPLPHDEATAFDDWLRDMRNIATIKIKRCYDTREGITNRQLHVFCDASEEAYAAVAYWRTTDVTGDVKLALVAGKAKVAPLKAQSIPRLELQAALIGSRLANTIVRHHPWKNVDVTLWSDSKTVIQWIRNETAKYTPYVAHRLSEISELTQSNQWRWLPTALNVADDATRAGCCLQTGCRWLVGPEFLLEEARMWPAEDCTSEQSNDCEVVYVNYTQTKTSLIDVTRFSNYERLIKTMAYVKLFIDKCRKRARKMTIAHIKDAERLIIKEAQMSSFACERNKLIQGRRVEKSSRLYLLDPQYGDDEIIRLNSRINAADVPADRRDPPILDGKCHVTRLIIAHEHKLRQHAGRELIVNNLRQKYWILGLRPAVRTVISRCVLCRARTAAPAIPVKGNLPSARLLANVRPFTNCGVDCYGPIWVTIGRRREKRWGMLFTCLVTRAIHIEIISSLSTDSAIMAIRRMAARRGTPRLIISDNGTNFHGADTELQNAYNEWRPGFETFALSKRIEWRFNDPGAPNQGGAWERMIRTVKRALQVVLKDRAPKEEVLSTLTAEIEHTVNSRPLTHISVSANDPEALTPNHFLLGVDNGLPYVGECNLADRKTWRAAQALANSFWTRWIREYLPTLAPRGDNRKDACNVKPGNVVIIADGLLPRNVWPRGVVTRVFEGSDGIVRSAEVSTKGGTFRRPVRRLVVLPLDE